MSKGIYSSCFIGAICSMLITSGAHADNSGQARAKSAAQAILGSPAPRVMLQTIDGESIDLGSLYGKKAVYLKFWATWCVPCRQQMPHFEHAYETAGTDLAVIAINVGFNDSLDAIQSYRKRLGITMPIVLDDGRLGAAFRLRVTPTHIVIGRDGRIQYVGHLADTQLDDALKVARGQASALVAQGKSRAAVALRETRVIAIGDPLPVQSLRTIDGQQFPLRVPDSGRSFTALVFLSPWCESYLATSRPTVAENCRNVRTQVSELANDQRVRWLGVASGLWADAADLRKYRREQHVTIPLTLDASGNIFREFRVNDVPTVLIADSHGKLLRRIEGEEASGPKTLTHALSEL